MSYPTDMYFAKAGDGVFSQLENNEIKLVDLKSNTTRILMSVQDAKDVSISTYPGFLEFRFISRRMEILCL